ncbi:MAG: hypothetical protein ISP45_16115 [Reyranella sp.]|nr:hypothetical protein [Reyranella sp.]
MTKRTFVATAAALFAAGTLATAGHAQTAKCIGLNACKGQGWTETSNAADCTAKGGKVM